MTHQEALLIPDLDIEVTELVEDAFYVKMSATGKISEEEGQKAARRLQSKYENKEQLIASLNTADKMICNLERYGVACASWCKN